MNLFHLITRATLLSVFFVPAVHAVPQWEDDALPSEFDWIQLTSGEWLAGEIETLYDDELEFDSDNLGQLTIDFDDIAQIRSQRELAVSFNDGSVREGKVLLIENEVRFDSAESIPLPMGEIVSMAQGAEREIDRWSSDITIGSNIKRGNTDEDIIDIGLNMSRLTSDSRFEMDYLGTFRNVNQVEVENSHRLTANGDRFLNQRFFWRPVILEVFRDELQNIQHRYTAGTGFGWHVIDSDRLTWDLSGGPGYQSTTFVSVLDQGDRTDGSYLLIAQSSLDYDLTADINFTMAYSLQYTNESLGRAQQNLNTGFEIDLLGELELDVSFIWDRIEEPQPLSDGSIPEKDDIRLSFGVSYEF